MTLEEKLKKLGDIHPNLFTQHKGLKQEFLTIIQQEIAEAKEEGFNAGCDYTCKQYGDGKTEAQIIAEAKPKWISVRDRLPEKGQQVLTYNPADKDDLFWVDYMFLNANKELRWDMGKDEVTYWMPLPKSPEEKL